jgi:hypothetical protein
MFTVGLRLRFFSAFGFGVPREVVKDLKFAVGFLRSNQKSQKQFDKFKLFCYNKRRVLIL